MRNPALSTFNHQLTMLPSNRYRAAVYLMALVWLINGLYCKVLNGVPRHEEIVARILGDEYAGSLTRLIGVLEILIAVWIVSRIWPRLAALLQIGLVLIMNLLEFALAPDLLLFGRLNMVFALLFAAFIYFMEFRRPLAQPG